MLPQQAFSMPVQANYAPQPPQPQQPPPAAGAAWPPKADSASAQMAAAMGMSPEQYHMMLLQQQLQQTQAHAQAQAQLLMLYQQQQQQIQLQNALAYQQMVQNAQVQAQAAIYGTNPYAGVYAQLAAQQQQQQQQQQQAQQQAAALQQQAQQAQQFQQQAQQMPQMPQAQQPQQQSMNQPTMSVTVGPTAAARGPPATATKPADSAPTVDARIHSNLAGSTVEWIPLPPRYVMDSVAKTAAATRLNVPHDDADNRAKTVFVGGISYDVARDPRVLPWLSAAMCRKPVVVRKVIPHKERRARTDGPTATGAAAPKLALSAFAVIDAEDVDHLIETMHHRVLWDIGGCWIARTPEAIDALRDYANAQCTWQRREAGAAAGLPRHMMTVEVATAVGSANHAAMHNHKGVVGNAAQRGQNVMSIEDTIRCLDNNTPPPPQSALVPKQPLLPQMCRATTPAALPTASLASTETMPAAVLSHDSPPLRLDWGMLHASYHASADRSGSTSPSDHSHGSGAIGDR